MGHVASRPLTRRDPQRIAALVASRTTSTQVPALRCDRRVSSVASRPLLSAPDPCPFVAQRIAGLRRFAFVGTKGRRQTAPRASDFAA
jgi:hypothetical protein